MCNKKIPDGGSKEGVFFACGQCDFILHFRCASIPFSIKHKYHRHELTFIDSFIEDESDEYYCDICENERKPQDHVYCCKKCRFVAHIGCALNIMIKFVDAQYSHGSTSTLVGTQLKVLHFSFFLSSFGMQIIDHFDHLHSLTLYEVIEQNESAVCKACCLKIYDHQAYACKSCKYYLHKTCAQLPSELLHPLHRQHSLKLLTAAGSGWLKLACHECGDCSNGFAYACILCGFMLDMKCIISVPKTLDERPKEMEIIRRPTLCLFNQNHKLYFVNYGSAMYNWYGFCSLCQQSLDGPCYECSNCGYQLHERCLIGFPREMQLQFHPLHPVYPLPHGEHRNTVSCSVCKYSMLKAFSYGCRQCDLHLHPACAEALVRVVKSNSHRHNLYYFRPYKQMGCFRNMDTCGECKEKVNGTPFYFCMECGIILHIGCAHIPPSVTSKYHLHPLTLEYYFMNDDSEEEYYCEICEEKRHPEDCVYYCEECQGLFAAHVGCVLASVCPLL
ncbi:hypothetical protein PTKIN_Ptkin06aG0173000 [Pterospermum kingtungense]